MTNPMRTSDYIIDIANMLSWFQDMGITDIVSDTVIDRTAVQKSVLENQKGRETLSARERGAPQDSRILAVTSRQKQQNPYIENEQTTQRQTDLQQTAGTRVPQMVAEARLLAQGASSVSDLQDALSMFTGCSLKETAIHTVFCDGHAEADIMLVGEAPGADEDRYGKPFIGKSGQLLDQMLSHIGLNRQHNLYITNVIPWRPPGNRAPTISEIDLCRPFVERHIQLIKPKLLILSGAIAAKTLLNKKQGITQLRGKWYEYDSDKFSWSSETEEPREGRDEKEKNMIPARAIFHPAFILRQPLQKKAIWADLLAIKQHMDQDAILT